MEFFNGCFKFMTVMVGWYCWCHRRMLADLFFSLILFHSSMLLFCETINVCVCVRKWTPQIGQRQLYNCWWCRLWKWTLFLSIPLNHIFRCQKNVYHWIHVWTESVHLFHDSFFVICISFSFFFRLCSMNRTPYRRIQIQNDFKKWRTL